jgi:hypothetical protein
MMKPSCENRTAAIQCPFPEGSMNGNGESTLYLCNDNVDMDASPLQLYLNFFDKYFYKMK